MEKRRNKLDDSEHWETMEFENGKVLSYFPLPSNKIASQGSTCQLKILRILLTSLMNFSSLTLIATITTIIVLPQSSPFSLSMYITEMIIYLLVSVTKTVYFEYVSGKSNQKINKRKVKVYRGKEYFESLDWAKVKQGDVVYLTQGEVAPADMIVLDSQQIQHREAVTYVDIRNVNGKTVALKKKAGYLTQMLTRGAMQKLNWENYQKIITGKISFERPTEDLETFTGYLKLTKDPKVQKLTMNNLILRESILKTSLWVYGLVVYTGMNTKIMKNRNSSANIKGIFNNKIDLIFAICFGVNLALGFIFSFLSLYRTENKEFFSMASYHFQMFSVLLPHALYIFYDVYLICCSFLYQEDGLQIRNFQHIYKLGKIDMAILSDHRVINSGELVVDQIVTPSAVYNIKTNATFKGLKKKKTLCRRNGSTHDSELSQIIKKNPKRANPFSHINNQLAFENSQTIEQQKFEIEEDSNVRMTLPAALGPFPKIKATQLEPLKITKIGLVNQVSEGGEQATDIIKSFVLCHQAKLFYNSQEEEYECTSNINSEEVLLKLAKDVGWQISPKMDLIKQVGVLVKQFNWINDSGKHELKKNHSYDWIGVNNFQIQRKLFSVVVKDGKKIVLYCKGKPEDMMERMNLNKETQKNIDNTLASYKNKKAETLIYAKKELSEEEKEFYESEYANLKYSLTTTEQEIEDFSKKWENKLEFLSIVSLSSQLNPSSKRLVQNLSESGIKICMISNNDLEIDIFKSVMQSGEESIEFVNFDKNTSQMTRYYLNEVTRKIKNQQRYNFGIIVNGQTWTLLQQNSDIMQHFMFVVYYCQGLIGYNFTPEQTAELTIRLKNTYPKQQSILAIGNSYGDLKFQDESDISISVGSLLPTDINVQNLEQAIKIISSGPKILETYIAMINAVLYRVVSLAVTIFIFQLTLIPFKASYTFDSTLVFIFVVVQNFSEIIHSVYYTQVNPKNQQKLPYYPNFKSMNTKIWLNILEAILHSGIIIGAVLMTLPQVRLTDGKTLPVGALHMAVFILLIAVSTCRYIFQASITKLRFLFLSLKTLFVFSISLFAASMLNQKFARISEQVLTLLSNYDSCTMLINTLLFCLAVTFFIEEVIKKYVVRDLRQEYEDSWENKEILKDIKKDVDSVALVRHLFKEEENIESSIGEIVGEKLDLNSLKVNKFVEIRNQQANTKNLYENHKRNSKNFIETLLLCLLIQLILVIIDATVLNSNFVPAFIPFIFGIVLTVPICLYVTYGEIKMNYYPLAEASISGICLVFCAYAIVWEKQSFFLLFCLLSLIVTQLIEIRMIVLTLISVCLIVANAILLLISNLPSGQIAFQIFFTIGCVLVNAIVLRNSLIESKINFIKNQAFEKQTHYVNDILSILVPKFVKKHLENYTQNFALQQKQNKVSVLFCYVCNFEAIVKEEGKNVVLIMDELFRQFDQLCHNFAVQKIETVGFTYMAATGIKVVEDEMENEVTKKNQVERLLKMGIQMLDKAKSVSWGIKKDKRLNIKIGIHHGDVVIGVIGYHKPQFSLIGDTVNTTSRHCSTGEMGDITLSAVAYQMLKRFSHNSFTKKQKQMKGLGMVNVYVYNKSDDMSSKHMLIKMKFRNCVNKVIEQLRLEQKIKYKIFKAADIANKLAEQVERQKTRKCSMRRSTERRRSSVNKLQELMEVFEQQKSEIIEGKIKNKIMPHNAFLELEEKNLDYQIYAKKNHSFQDKIILSTLLPLFVINIVYNSVCGYWTATEIVLRIVALIVYTLGTYFYTRVFRSETNLWLFTVCMAYILLIENLTVAFGLKVSVEERNTYSFAHFNEYFPMMILTVLSASHGYRFLHILLLSIFSIAVSIADMSVSGVFEVTILYEAFYYGLVLFRKYLTLRQCYNNYIQMVNYEKRNKEQSDLVSQLLPKHAYEKLKNQNIQNRLELTDQFENCTMLYADIKGFTSFSKKHQNEPDIIVEMLRKLFQEFDKKCLEHNVYKVYTIGDCYVVLGFTNCYQRDILQEAKNVVNMGLSMVEHIQIVREKYNFSELDMRIGIHTGKVIGGIIGTEIVRYDIYGPDVMIANKFQQKGETGHIHISESTKEILDQDKKSPYNIVPHGKVSISKLNAEYNSYLLSKKKFEI